MKLLIVESPTKAKKLRQFLSRDYQIEASYGHVRDLPRSGDLGVTFSNGDVVAQYQVIDRAKQAVGKLRSLAQRADEVLLATDPDREGEAIAWHVAELLPSDTRCQRVSFNAITKTAVEAALGQPRAVDADLVGAQQARRVLDRVVGWLVSPTVKRGTGLKGAKSAGRVQSVALRLVAERERDIQAFTARTFFTFDADLQHAPTPPPFTARLIEWKGEPLEHRLAEHELAERTKDWCLRQTWTVKSVDRREQQRRPPPPFVTATIQQAASVKLRFTPKVTMQLLQKLFESGHITYHRTDSVAVAPEAIAAAREVINQRFAADYLPAKAVQHAAKASNAQEAHEAIRPTEADRDRAADGDAAKLYRLIWERFIASQMANGRDFLTTINVAIADGTFTDPQRGSLPMGVCEAKGKVVRFDGWRTLTDDATDETGKGARKKKTTRADAEHADTAMVLPDVPIGTVLELTECRVIERSTKAPARYTQASLIKKLEKLGVGRPSTYAAILTTIVEREYVAEKKRKLHATALGLAVTDYLCKQYQGNFIEIDFTARMEALFDSIATGDAEWQRVITEAAFEIRTLAQQAGLYHDPLTGAGPPETDQKCPICSGPMVYRSGKFGPFWACKKRDCRGTRNIPK